MVVLQLSFGYYHWQKPDKVAHHLKRMSGLKRWNKVAKTFAYLTLFMCTLLSFQIAAAPIIGIAPNDAYCQIRVYCGALTYHWSKGCVYGVLIARLRIAYVNRKFSYSTRRVIYPFYGLLFIYFVCICILDATQIVSHYEPNKKWCHVDYSIWQVIATLIFDSIFIIVCLILLIKPLQTNLRRDNSVNSINNDSLRKPKISNNNISYDSETDTNTSGSTKTNTSTASTNTNSMTIITTSGNIENDRKRRDIEAKFKLGHVISKYRKLSLVTQLSTSISMGFYTIGLNDINNNVYIASIAGGVLLIDNVISVIFVFLFSSKHNDLYDKLCVCKTNTTKITQPATALGINVDVNGGNLRVGKIAVGATTPSICTESHRSTSEMEKSPYAAAATKTLSPVPFVKTTGVVNNDDYDDNYIDSDDDDKGTKVYGPEGNELELEVIDHEMNENENENKDEKEVMHVQPIPNLQNSTTHSGISATEHTEFR